MTEQRTEPDWTQLLASQLGWHWENQLRARLDGLTDEEYFWRPVPDAWTINPPGEGDPEQQFGGGHTMDFAFPPPDPAPVTTIAWRLGHLLVGVFGDRNARYFDGPATDYRTYDYPAGADEALRRLDDGYRVWIDGVRGLTHDQLIGPCREPGFEQDPVAAMILHIHRELIHHGAEISLLRDLYRARST